MLNYFSFLILNEVNLRQTKNVRRNFKLTLYVNLFMQAILMYFIRSNSTKIEN